MKNFIKTTFTLFLLVAIAACGSNDSSSTSGNSADSNPIFNTYTTVNGIKEHQMVNPEAPTVANGATVSVNSVTIDTPVISGAAKISFEITSLSEYMGGFVIVTLNNVGLTDRTQDDTAKYVMNSLMQDAFPTIIPNYLAHYEYGSPTRRLDPRVMAYVKETVAYNGNVDLVRNGSVISATSYSYAKDVYNRIHIIPYTSVFNTKNADGTPTVDLAQPLEVRVHACIYENAANPATYMVNSVENKSYSCTTKSVPVSIP